MILPKESRKQLYEAQGKPVEVVIPDGEECRAGKEYGLETKKGGRRQATVFVDSLEQVADQRLAVVRLVEQPRHLAKQQGLYHPQQYTTSSVGGIGLTVRTEEGGVEVEAEPVPEEFQTLLSEEGLFATRLCGATKRQEVRAIRAEAHLAKERSKGKPGTLAAAAATRQRRHLGEAA